MTTIREIGQLILWVEGSFQCTVGEPRSYFEMSKADGLKRGIYEVMGVAAEVTNADLTPNLLEWARRGFADLKGRGATRIVWRHGTRMEFRREHSCEVQGAAIRIYTRFVALDPQDNQVKLAEPWVKPEAGLYRFASRELLEDMV